MHIASSTTPPRIPSGLNGEFKVYGRQSSAKKRRRKMEESKIRRDAIWTRQLMQSVSAGFMMEEAAARNGGVCIRATA